MNEIYIICVDDQPEVLSSLEQDLNLFEDKINLEVCESGNEALELMESIDQTGDFVAVVISDQVMPDITGVELFELIEKDGRFSKTLKILLTGLATHEDTIAAINSGGLDFYVEKPWQKSDLLDLVKRCLTRYVLNSGIDYQAYIDLLNQKILYQELRNNT